MAALIARFLPLGAAQHVSLAAYTRPVLRNWNGFDVGSLRVTDAI
jgi:hypothetical protein